MQGARLADEAPQAPGPWRGAPLWALRGVALCGLCAAACLWRSSAAQGWHGALPGGAAAEAGARPQQLAAAADEVRFHWTEVLAAYSWWPLIFYMFYVMSVVCDDYLVPAVDALCRHFRIPEDVAGATLVAFACNGPELLTNVCGIFLTKTSVGMGTIVGSAIFNVLVITGACPLVAPKGELVINKPFFLRDAGFSAISILLLWWALPVIDLLRASVLLGFSVVYVVVVAKSEAWFGGASNPCLEPMLMSVGPGTPLGGSSEKLLTLPLATAPSLWSIAEAPAKRLAVLTDAFLRPTSFVLALTLHDLRGLEEAPTVPRMLSAFFVAMAWLSGTAYVVCLGSDEINRYFGVPQALLGLTLVAVGTSWPNLVASVVTARAGRGAIAISNALGSNVQNVFFVLAGPIWVSVLLHGSYNADGTGILASVVWMGVTLAWVVGAIALSGFRLTSAVGWSYMVIYAAYLVQATMLT